MSSLFDPNLNQEASSMGLISNIDGTVSRRIITHSMAALDRLSHSEEQSSNHNIDGCGLLVPIPREFFYKQWPLLAHKPLQSWAVGQLFLPRNSQLRTHVLNIIRQNLDLCDLHLLDGREVPISSHILHKNARLALPFMAQILVCPKENTHLHYSGDVFERRLFLARRIIEKNVNNFLQTHGHDTRQFHVVSFSAHTIVYKAIISGSHLSDFYKDLQHDAFTASYAIFHKRFSNNRVPSWRSVQPMRLLAHSGEIHSLNGILHYIEACLPVLKSSLFGQDLKKLLPIIYNRHSPAAALDNLCEFLHRCGRNMQQVLMMLFPEHITHDSPFSIEQSAFYKFHAALLPPLSGSSCVIFSDGARFAGAIQDIKSKQSCRYSISTDGLFILGTEQGLLDIPTKKIQYKNRLRPGEIIVLDTLGHRILFDKEIKGNIIHEQKYSHIVSNYLTYIDDNKEQMAHKDYTDYTASFKKWDNTSNNTSAMPIFNEATSFFDYFHIINPPLTTNSTNIKLESFVGKAQNFLEPHPELCKTLYLNQPFINTKQLTALLKSEHAHICLHAIHTKFDLGIKSGLALSNALEDINYQAELALKNGATILLLSYKDYKNNDIKNTSYTLIPSLLAIASLHKHLLKKHLRYLCGIIVEPHDAHKAIHMALLLNCGANAICLEPISQSNNDASHHKYLQSMQHELSNILKIIGIHSMLSLQDGQHFEAVGICSQVINKYFNGIVSRMDGINLEQIAHEAKNTSHKNQDRIKAKQENYNIELMNLLQLALTRNSVRVFRSYLKHCHNNIKPHSLRCLLKPKEYKYIPHMSEAIEPSTDIVKRFAMPFVPNLSKKARQCLAHGYYHAGCISKKINTDVDFSQNYELHLKNLHLDRIVNCEEIQISLGKHITTTYDFFTLNHHDLASLNNIRQLIYDLRKAHPQARITIKIPAHLGIGNLGVGLVKAGAHCLLIYGCADIPISSPLFPMSYQAIPWEMGLAELQHALTANNLRRQVRLRLLAQLFTGKDIIKATLLGAEEFVFPTPLLLSLGCKLCHKCNDLPCPEALFNRENKENLNHTQSKFKGDSKHITRFLYFLADDVRRELAMLGFAYLDQLVGRANLLELEQKQHKSISLNLSPLTQGSSGTLGQRNGSPSYAPLPCTPLEKAILEKMLHQKHKKNITYNYCGTINIGDRSIGTHISGEILRHNAKQSIIKNTNHNVNIKLWGSAGQSLGAFLNKDITLWVFGDANDHVGKGLSGGTIAISHAPDSPLKLGTHSIIGNVALYGASCGELYIAGMAGEYFAVYNNGACAVVEGVGDFACQHMLDGTIIVLGPCGKNFAQNMLGGRVYVFTPPEHLTKEQHKTTNNLDEDDVRTLRYLLKQHIHFTKSHVAKNILNDWDNSLEQFIMIKA